MKSTRPAEVFPPGDFIRDELQARGWTQADLAKITGRPLSFVNLLISGKRGITAETACELSNAFDTSAEFWLNLEGAYKLSKVSAPMAEIREMASIYAKAPIKEMEQRGWIRKTESAEELKREVTLFYSSIKLDVFKLAARVSDEQGVITDAQLAWCVKCLDLARSVKAQPYIDKNAQDCEKSLRRLAAHREGVSRISAALAGFGIRFVVVKHLKGTKIDGAALWLGSGWDKPVIALSARFDRIDWLRHTLLHEFSHIKHRDSIARIDVDMFGYQSKHACVKESATREMPVKIRDILISHSMTDGFGSTVKPLPRKIACRGMANLATVRIE